jgi:hypothetical protein
VASGSAKGAEFGRTESFTVGPVVRGANSEDWAATVIYARAKLRWEGAIGVFFHVKNSTLWSAIGGFQSAQGLIAQSRSRASREISLSHNPSPYVELFQQQQQQQQPPQPQQQVSSPAAAATPPPVSRAPPAPTSTTNLAGPIAGSLAGVTVLGVFLLLKTLQEGFWGIV